MFLVIGSTTVDLFISGVGRIPRWSGDEFRIDNLAWCRDPLHMTIGGNGANTAYTLGRLGARVALHSAVGADILGDIMVGWLNTANVDLRHLIHRLNASTSTTTIVIDDERNRLSFHHPGAYATYSMRDLPENWTHGVSTVVVASYPLMGGLRPYGVRKIMAIAHAAGIRTALDIGPAIGELTTFAELRPLLPDVDYLLANEHELLVLTGESDAPAQIAAMHAAGANTVVLRRGKHGVAVSSAAENHVVPAFSVDVQRTVGAGDVFNAGFLWGIDAGWSLAKAAEFGNAAGALVVASDQGVLGAATREEVEQFIQSHRFFNH